MTDVVVTVRPSMKALIGGCQIPDMVKGQRAKSVTDMVQPVIMPFSSSELEVRISLLSLSHVQRN